jgi:hypothetical protein
MYNYKGNSAYIKKTTAERRKLSIAKGATWVALGGFAVLTFAVFYVLTVIFLTLEPIQWRTHADTQTIVVMITAIISKVKVIMHKHMTTTMTRDLVRVASTHQTLMTKKQQLIDMRTNKQTGKKGVLDDE